jgi:hypothetical protein
MWLRPLFYSCDSEEQALNGRAPSFAFFLAMHAGQISQPK